jgi:pyridinium-3,5-bisthiocarboxylic acid mononucleotide nickel chelatase
MTTIAWYHCFSGIAGDMALGALLDAGADLDEVLAIVGKLPVDGWSVEAEPVLRGGIAATWAKVTCQETSVVRTYAHITGMLETATLPERVRQRAQATFRVLAAAEGRLHRRPPEQVHFHEVGALDAIVDVVGNAAALEVLGVDEVHSSPVANGMGMIRSAHGAIPNPPPAVLELLQGAPTYGVDLAIELTTPTGAALLAGAVTSWGPLPPMTLAGIGFGAGARDLDGRPNLVQVVVGELAAGPLGGDPGQPVVQLEANVDDATGETLAHAISALLEVGAHDAWITPVVMKKGRPGHTVAALCDPVLAPSIAERLQHETGSLGVRATTLARWPAARAFDEVTVEGLPVRVKISPGRVKVEADDAAWVARRTGLPFREVVSRAEAEARSAELSAPPQPPSGGDGTPA